MTLRRAQKHNHASEHKLFYYHLHFWRVLRKYKPKNWEKIQKEGEGIPDGVGQHSGYPRPLTNTVQTWPVRRLHCRLTMAERYKTLQSKAIRGKAHEGRTGIL